VHLTFKRRDWQSNLNRGRVLRHARFKRWRNHDFGGGISLKLEGKVVGAIGVSGQTLI
jgi:uncharacterized protein GlcG (DUF336 family)